MSELSHRRKSNRLEVVRPDPLADRLARVRDEDLAALASDTQQAHNRRESSARQARYDDSAVAVALYYDVRGNRIVRGRFRDVFEQQFRREPKAESLLRDVFLFLYGEARKGMAGTDAIALGNAVKTRVPARKIPSYIREKGGLEKLLQSERIRQDPMEVVEIYIRRSVLKRLDALALGAHAGVTIMRSPKEQPETVKFAIIHSK